MQYYNTILFVVFFSSPLALLSLISPDPLIHLVADPSSLDDVAKFVE